MADGPLETIKEYLVELGFSVDNNSYNAAKRSLDEAEHTIMKFAGGAASDFALAGTAITAFTVAAVAGIAKFVSGLGEAQIQYEILARQLWTTQDNAMAFSTAMKAMGTNLQELYLSPTLMKQFQELRQEAVNLAPPSEYKDQMNFIQSITFEFKRMKLEGTYALQWIGYYFIKYMQGPITSIHDALQHINDVIIKQMPNWTKVVAKVMAGFADFGIATYHAISVVGQVFDDIGKSIPKNVKLIGGAIAGLAIIIETGPVGIFVAALVGLILLLDDLYTYMHGGKSEFGPMWQKMIDWGKNAKKGITDFYDALKDNGTIKAFTQAGQSAFDTLKNAIDGVKSEFQVFNQDVNNSNLSNQYSQNIEQLVKAFADLTNALSSAADAISNLKSTQNIFSQFGGFLSKLATGALTVIDDKIKEVTNDIELLADAINGLTTGKWDKFKQDWAKAWSSEGWGSTPTADFIKAYISGLDQLGPPSGNNSNTPTPYMGNPMSYLHPPSHSTTNHSQVQLNQTNNVYSSDPNAAGKAVQQNTEHLLLPFLLRSVRGNQR